MSILIMDSSCQPQDKAGQDPYSRSRQRMVNEQIKARGIRDTAVLRAMMDVPRHLFVPPEHRADAYEDYPLPIGGDQTISQPYIVAFMTAALELEPKDRVLEVGTGSGYQAAVLAEICDSVFTIEIMPELARNAQELLSRLHYRNVMVREGDGYRGWPEKAPFDAIMVTCSPTHVPKPLQDQLKEGGKMIIPVGPAFSQELYLLVKEKGKLKQHSVLPVRFVPMIDDKGGKY